MRTQRLLVCIVSLSLSLRKVLAKPISVPVDNNYSYNNPSYGSGQNYYDDISSRRPNSYFNRLPSNAQNDDVGEEEYDYDDQQTDKPVPTNQQYENLITNNNNNYQLTENRVKFKKKKRRMKRPCIPIQSFGSPLFSNRLRRDLNSDAESGKTLGLLLGGGGYNQFYNPGYGPGYYRPQDNVKPQYDNQNYGQPFYSPQNGYPCVPVNLGHKPNGGHFGGGGLFGSHGGGSSGLYGGSSTGGGGGLGFFGQGGLLDFSSVGSSPLGGLAGSPLGGSGGSLLGGSGGSLLGGSGGSLLGGSPGPLSPAGIYQGAGSYPQTVIINRPPLFSFNTPSNQYGSQSSQSSSSYPQDSNNPGFWGSVVNKLQEFVRMMRNSFDCIRYS